MTLQNFLLTLALAISSAALTTNASAQEKTRAEVRQELIDAQNNGLNFVTDASYPDVSPIYQQQVERLKMQHSGSGPSTSSTSDAGQKADVPMDNTHAMDDCVGPAGFCKPYFGS
jgi:4-diphosphocytidyl-2C-methyl-D-erythritol kinase